MDANVNKKVTAVSERQALSRLKLNELRQMCKDVGVGLNIGKHKKGQLIEQIISATEGNRENISPGQKQQALPGETESETPFWFEVDGYHLDPMVSHIPPVKFLNVYTHIVEESGRNSKCMDRGVKHFDENDIQELAYKEVSDYVILFRAKCIASQKKLKYTVYVAVQRKLGTCLSGRCDCPQGLPGNCSHVCGLLLALEYMNRTKAQNPGDLSCTSQLCKWRKPRSIKVSPKPLNEIAIYKPTYGKEPKKPNTSSHDPRARTDRLPDMKKVYTQLNELLSLFPSCGVQQFWDIPVTTPEVGLQLEIQPCELDLLAESLVITPLQSCQSDAIPDVMDVNSFIEKQKISAELCHHVEQITQQQSFSPLWKQLHKGRLTSSVFGDVFASQNSRENKSLVNRIMGYTEINRLPWTMRWGKEKEKEAISAYETVMKSCGTPVSVKPTGLTLSCKYSFLGASSDGRVFDNSQPEGLKLGALEVKCPCSLEGIDVRDKPLKEIALSNKFYMQIGSDGKLSLKKSSKYYCQVQGEMAIMNVGWVDLVVWNRVDIAIERIFFNVEFWECELRPKLLDFYVHKIVPHILG